MTSPPRYIEQLLRSPSRLEALRQTALLGTPPEEAFDRLTRLACLATGAPAALLSLVGEDRQFFKSVSGLSSPSRREMPLSQSVCQYVVTGGAPLILEDVRKRPLLRHNRAAIDEGAVAYLGVPLYAPEGQVIGSFCVIDYQPRAWTEDDLGEMQDLAAAAATEIALRAKVRLLERGQRQLVAQKALNSTTLDTLLDVFFVLDTEARLVRWNRRLREVTGFADEEIRGRRARDFFLEEDKLRLEEALNQVVAEGEATVHARVVTKTGVVIPYEFNGRALKDGGGRVVGLCGTGRDLSGRIRSAEVLRRKEERFRSFVEATAQAVWQADAEGHVTEMSEAWQALTGQSAEEAAGWGWADALHVEDRPRIAAMWAEHVASRSRAESEYRVRHADGTYGAIAVRAVPVTYSDGSFAGWVGTCTDIETQRQAEAARAQSEEHMRLAMRAAEMGTWDIDLQTGEVHLSAQAEKLLGLEPGHFEGTPATLQALIHPQDRTDVREAGEQVIARREDGAVIDLEYRAVGPGGEVLWLHSLGRLYCDGAGKPHRLIGTVVDVTARRSYEEGLVEARERAEEARREAEEMARLKDTFLASMSHEIRTPLTGILGFAEILGEEITGDHQELARLIEESGHRLMDTLTSVLDLARLEGGEMKLAPGRMDVAEEARSIAGLLGRQARGKGLTFHVVGPPRPVYVHVDAGALSRVLTHLVSNAIKFTTEGGVTVRVEARAAEVALSIEDTGVGIGEAFLPDLFEPFRQESEGLGRNFEGVGLGLAIARRLTGLMGGRIEVESTKGTGSVFRLVLPAAQ